VGPLLALTLLAYAFGTAASAAPTEPQGGAQVLGEVRAGTLAATSLSELQYQRVGQYLMSRALGSTQRYESMDSLMDRVMGQSVSDQMYLYMGERYLGRTVAPNGRDTRFYGWMASMMGRYRGAYAGMMGGYMMGAYRALSGDSSAPYAGMMGGNLRRPAGQGGGNVGGTAGFNPFGGMMRHGGNVAQSGSGDWPAGAIIAVGVLAAALLAGGLALGLPKLRARRGGSTTPAAGRM
jgi:hypothetical protein